MDYTAEINAFGEWTIVHPLGANEAALWLRLMWLFDKAGWPERLAIGNSRLAGMMGLSCDTLSRTRKKLADCGRIEVASVRGADPEYRMILFADANKAAEEPAEESAEETAHMRILSGGEENPQKKPQKNPQPCGFSSEISRADAQTTPAQSIVSLENENNINNYNKNKEGVRGRAAIDEKTIREREMNSRFDEFWAAYPRKEGKIPAEKAFRKLAPTERVFQAMMAGLARDKASLQWRTNGGAYIPHPTTWLNQRRWIRGDEPQPSLAQSPSRRESDGPDWFYGGRREQRA